MAFDSLKVGCWFCFVKSGNASAIHFKIWLILRRKRRLRTIVDNVDSSLFQQSEDRVCWSLLSYFVKCDIYMYPYIILVWDTHFLEKSGSWYTGWGTCCWCFALCKPRLLKTYWRLRCMLKTELYAAEDCVEDCVLCWRISSISSDWYIFWYILYWLYCKKCRDSYLHCVE